MAKILIISLDKNILDQKSRAAERMKQYGQRDEIFIIIPAEKELGFDLSSSVHVFSIGGNKLAQFFGLLILGRKIIKEQKIDLITAQDPFFIGLLGFWLKKKTSVPLEAQVHGDFYGSDYYRRSGFGNWFRYYLSRWVIRRADHLRVVSQRIKESLIRLGMLAEKIEVRPVVVNEEEIKNDQPKFDLYKKYPGCEKIFLVLGRLETVKNISWLIDVFSQVIEKSPACLLLIVGTGSEKDKLVRKVERLGLTKNIKFEDWTDDPYSYLKTADCLLFPSLSEGYGLVVMEAMAAGTPVIMSEVGVAGYELKLGPKVTIVPVGDKEKFMAAILKI